MICALTVRTLKPGTFDQFREAFMSFNNPDDPPPGWVRFDMVRNTDKPDEVVCFGFYDGTVDDIRRMPRDDYERQQAAIAPFVESVGADGFYEIAEEYSLAPGAAA